MTALQRLADAVGIVPRWRDIAGREHVTTAATQQALLAGMGFDVVSDGDAAAAADAVAAARDQRGVAEDVVIAAARDATIRLPGAAAWRLVTEEGEETAGAGAEVRVRLPVGLHTLWVGDDRCLVISAPPRAPTVADVLGRDKAWGMCAALYGLCSARNLGVGDYRDLADAAEALARHGAAFLGINPVHARGAASGEISPYSPSCRTAYDTRHIAVDAVPGFGACAAAHEVLAADGGRDTAGDEIDYQGFGVVHDAVLRRLFAAFDDDTDAAGEFDAWDGSVGEDGHRFAVFEAIAAAHGDDWQAWPAALRDVENTAVGAFARAHTGEVRYHAWLQWLAGRQLAAAQDTARSAGMGLGLYLDLAVGVRAGGADTWMAPGCFADGVSLGAPPDSFNPGGQTWNLAPFNPMGLRAAAYDPFIKMLRSAMAHAGLLRIDHVIGAQRSFWVPADGVAGGYVSYPLETLLALIRVEAWRAGCVVVGEDLGSVPAGLREELAAAGLYGCAVTQFEQDEDGFRPPRRYRTATLASFGTHDTPTLRGWWAGRDIAARHEVGQTDGKADRMARRRRDGERAALAQLLTEEGLAPAGLATRPPAAADDDLVDGVHALVAGAASALVAVQLDDALGVEVQQNLPGTVDEYPNWRRRYPTEVASLADDAGLKRVAAIFARGGRAGEEQRGGRDVDQDSGDNAD